METVYQELAIRGPVPQTQPIPGREGEMVLNHQGGYVFDAGDWAQLGRWLVLGSEAGTYYANAKDHTIKNFDVLKRCVAEDAMRVIEMVIEMSTNDRVPKMDPCLLALAYVIQKGNTAASARARDAFSQIARIGTWELQAVDFLDRFGGWGRGKRDMISAWYNRDPREVAYQVLKYRNRAGWTHRDVLRQAHVIPSSGAHKAIFNWVTQGWEGALKESPMEDTALAQIWAYERARVAEKEEVISLIERYRLTHEMLPSRWLADKDVWRALLFNSLPKTALMRNLGRLTRLGVIKPLGAGEEYVAQRLTDGKGRLPHPISVLLAMDAYRKGVDRHGYTWRHSQAVLDALEELFYQGFGQVEGTGKRTLIALDCSASMDGNFISGTLISARDAAAAMAMVTIRSEQYYHVIGFSNTMRTLHLTKRMSLSQITSVTSGIPFGGTYCEKPMIYAIKHGLDVDTFIIYTDNETAHGDMHPSVALQRYRDRTGIPAKLIVVALTATQFSIADPKDPGMLDVIGLDAGAPKLISDFARMKL